jgi:hypothetical protein
VQAAAAPESSLQLNVDPGLLEVKLKLAVVWLDGFAGVDVIDATGGLTVTVQVNETGAETFPAVSVAVTVKVWLAALNPE